MPEDYIKKVNILGINVNVIRNEELFKRIKEFLESKVFHYIVTPNPEIILEAQKNEEFFNVLNQSDLSIPDGIGLKFASWALFSNLHRFTGADLSKQLLRYSERESIKIGIVNWKKSLSKNKVIEKYLKKEYPKLDFIIIDSERDGNVRFEELENFSPKIIFVTLGAPYQEILIYKKIKQIKSVCLAVGIGGAFDFLTKKIKRAPFFVKRSGFEWLWRIFQEPKGRKVWRLKRIYNAVFIFSLKFLKWRFVLPFVYRKNVACLVYKKSKDRIKVFLAKRQIEKNHWQIIQGGIGSDTIELAARKEISEELGIRDFKIIKTTNFIFKYNFPKKNIHRGGVYKRHTGFKGQRQALAIAEYYGKDDDIKVNYWDHSDWKWVDLEDLLDTVHETRKIPTKMFYDILKAELEKNEKI